MRASKGMQPAPGFTISTLRASMTQELLSSSHLRLRLIASRVLLQRRHVTKSPMQAGYNNSGK